MSGTFIVKLGCVVISFHKQDDLITPMESKAAEGLFSVRMQTSLFSPKQSGANRLNYSVVA